MATAARWLHEELGSIVKMMDKNKARGRSDAEAWASMHQVERPPTRSALPKSALYAAVRLFAESRVVDGRRHYDGLDLGQIAMLFVRQEIDVAEALRLAQEVRGDEWSPGSHVVGALKSALAERRSEPERWKAVYKALADGAYVHPLSDTRRGLRGNLKELHAAVVRLLKRD